MIGKKIGHYEIEAKLGAGGYGVVYKARDTRLRRPVALKFLKTLEDGPAKLEERFLREARAMAAINHPHVVTIHEIRKVDNSLCICTEFIEGEDLEDRVERETLTPTEALEIAIPLLEALDALHAKDIVHRDLKPANIRLPQTGGVKLMDFGIAVGGELKKVTAEGNVSGTVGYMSPEQLRGKNLNASSDLFSLGAVLYEAITGEKPFGGKTASECIAATLTDDPTPIRKSVPATPKRLEKIILRCLHKEQAKRYQSAAEMRDDLIAIRDGNTATAPTATRSHARFGLPQWGMVAALLVAVGAGLWFLTQGGSNSGSGGAATVASTPGPFQFDAKMVRVNPIDGGATERTVLTSGDTITTGDYLKCEVTGNQPYHLYVFVKDSEDRWQTLFPDRRFGISNPIEPGKEPRVMPPGKGLRTTGTPGEERFWFIATLEPSPELEAKVALYPAVPMSGEQAQPIPAEEIESMKMMTLRGFELEVEDDAGVDGVLTHVGNRAVSIEVSLDHR